jgi:hypothetical protein
MKQWGSLKLKSGSTTLKMATCLWTVTSIPGDRQRAEMLLSYSYLFITPLTLIDKVWTSIMEDHRLTVWKIADEVGISRGSKNAILTEDLSMRRVAAAAHHSKTSLPECFHRWKHHWAKCMESQGACFEGD